MPALQVKEFPDDLYARLRACAAQEHRSIAQQTLSIIQQYVSAKESAAQRVSGSSVDFAGAFSANQGESAGAAAQTLSFFSERETRAAQRRAAFERMEKRAPVRMPEEYETVASLVAASREERW